MSMIPAKSIVSSNDRIAFEQIASFSSLFIHYTQYHKKLAPFFEGDYRREESFQLQAERTLAISRNRSLLSDVLLEQNTRWGLDQKVERNIELLRQEDSMAVVTGQQLGLFLSPLYIPYKVLTTILLAEQLSSSLRKPVIPVFWLHGEDHDFDETASVHLIDKNHTLKSLKYSPENTGSLSSQGPVGRMKFTAQIESLLNNLEKILPPSPNKRDLISFLRDHYYTGGSLLDGFAFFLKRLFMGTGLVLFSVDNPRIKRECIPLFKREIEHPEVLSQAVRDTNSKLEKSYHIQVKVRPTNLFMMDDDSRTSINAMQDVFHMRGKAPIQHKELLSVLEHNPERFSPNVIFRPIVQDFLFPTISYIGGPGEIAYFAQCRQAYEWAEIPMPLIFPRASITIIEPTVAKVLDRYPYSLSAYNEDPEKLFRDYAIHSMPINIESTVKSSLSHVDLAISELEEAVHQIDQTLLTSTASTQVRIYKDIERLKDRIIKAQKRKQEIDRLRIHRANTHLFPNRSIQERSLSPLHFINLYGLDFFRMLLEKVSLDTTTHQIIRL